MSELTDALNRERVILEEKLQRVRDLLALYDPSDAMAHVTPKPSRTATNGHNPSGTRSRLSPKTVMMDDEITALLRDKVQVHRSALLNDLMTKGIMGGEKNPMAHLASFLSERRDKYAGDGRGNFHLREQGSVPNEQNSDRPLSGPTEPESGVA